jgi:peptidoglycan hydrolase-like protein with peptidoglycan-binding domain
MVAVQTALQREGLYRGTIDGVTGPRTRAAVDAWLGRRPTFRAQARAIGDPARQEYEIVRGILARVPAET